MKRTLVICLGGSLVALSLNSPLSAAELFPANCDTAYCDAVEQNCSWWRRIFGHPLPPKAIPCQAKTEGLPKGRSYFGHRYYGNFNNRFYGPQYGNF